MILSSQVDADDVLTKKEQMSLIFKAKEKCEQTIKYKHNTPGELYIIYIFFLLTACSLLILLAFCNTE